MKPRGLLRIRPIILPASPHHTQLPGWDYLLTEQGIADLQTLARDHAHGVSTAQLSQRLRSTGHEPEQVAALLTQADLRRKAERKFGDLAQHMLFTPAGLEQASRFLVAQAHAERFTKAELKHVADLGSGIGTESMALVKAGITATAVEIDPFTAEIAGHNLALMNTDRSLFHVKTADATMVNIGDCDGAFLDPARRTSGHRNTRRLTSHTEYSPSLDFAFELARTLPTGIKLGPGVDRELIPANAEAQWISDHGEVVEMGLWFGALARSGVHRSALVFTAVGAHELTAAADSPDAPTSALGEFLYEPDGSIIRARLIGLLAEQLNASMISDNIAYLSSDSYTPTPFAQGFRIIAQLPASEKHLKRALAERGIGRLEIKKRGADVDPAALRTRLRLKGPGAATMFLTRVAGQHTALLAERL